MLPVPVQPASTAAASRCAGRSRCRGRMSNQVSSGSCAILTSGPVSTTSQCSAILPCSRRKMWAVLTLSFWPDPLIPYRGRSPWIVPRTSAQASDKRGLVRAVVRFQAYLFFPLLLLEAGHLHAASIKAVLGGRERLDRVEALLLLVHAGAYFAMLLLVLSPLRAAAFLLLQQGLFGLYLGCCFAPNHKGMPMLEEGKEPDYLRRQVLTSRNV